MKNNSVKKPDRCPKCGSDKIANILYGMPAFSESLKKDLDDNKIILGGCFISNESPTWKCTVCGTVIKKLEIDFDESIN
jgi:hypothetical protein